MVRDVRAFLAGHIGRDLWLQADVTFASGIEVPRGAELVAVAGYKNFANKFWPLENHQYWVEFDDLMVVVLGVAISSYQQLLALLDSDAKQPPDHQKLTAGRSTDGKACSNSLQFRVVRGVCGKLLESVGERFCETCLPDVVSRAEAVRFHSL